MLSTRNKWEDGTPSWASVPQQALVLGGADRVRVAGRHVRVGKTSCQEILVNEATEIFLY